jgi:hypothetical protein
MKALAMLSNSKAQTSSARRCHQPFQRPEVPKVCSCLLQPSPTCFFLRLPVAPNVPWAIGQRRATASRGAAGGITAR